MSDQKPDKTKKLVDTLGFDPAKAPTGSAAVLTEVIAEITKERDDKIRIQLKELLTKAMDLRVTVEKAKKAFDKETQKYEKELGKILNDLERLASGKDAPEEPVEDDKAA